MHRQVGALDVLELRLDALFGRVDDDARALTEYEFLYLDKAEQRAVADFAGIHLVDLPLAHENDLVQCLVAHRCTPKVTHRRRFRHRRPIGHIWSSFRVLKTPGAISGPIM